MQGKDFKEENITVLKNEMATRAGILDAIKFLHVELIDNT